MQPIMEIRHLRAAVEGVEILKGVDLVINAGEVHSIMGPNGSGKSTLAQVIAGNETYEVTEGEILFKGKDISELSADERAGEGMFLAFQYPVEIPGVSNMQFLKSAVNSVRGYRGEKEVNALEFMKMIKAKQTAIGLDEKLLKRSVNEGFSGGEKKRYEIFQMALLDPQLGILDETDSGLDIDALKIAAEGVNSLRDEERSFLVITHYQRLLNYIVPDFVHVLFDGRIVKSGGKELALDLEERGYGWLGNGAVAKVG